MVKDIRSERRKALERNLGRLVAIVNETTEERYFVTLDYSNRYDGYILKKGSNIFPGPGDFFNYLFPRPTPEKPEPHTTTRIGVKVGDGDAITLYLEPFDTIARGIADAYESKYGEDTITFRELETSTSSGNE